MRHNNSHRGPVPPKLPSEGGSRTSPAEASGGKRITHHASRLSLFSCVSCLSWFALPDTYAQTISQAGMFGQETLSIPAFQYEPTPGENILRYGPWDVLPRIRAGLTYDDNIYIQRANKTDDFIWSISPGVMLGAGDYRAREGSSALVDYAPTVNLFSQHSRNNSIDHDARLRAEWRPGRWSAALEQIYQNYSGPVLDVGNRVDRSFYDTRLSFTYELSPKTSIEVTGNQLIADYDQVSSYNEWTLGGFFDYALTPKIKIGAGVNAGWLDIQNSGNQHYQQGLVRATYSATAKLDFRGSAGVEVREFQSGQDDHLNGVFSLGGTYKPLEYTQVIFDAYRRDQNSVVLADQNYTTTGLSLGVRQQFLLKYAASLTGGYDHLHYHNAAPTAAATRMDDYYFVRAGLDWHVMDRLTAGAFYLYRKNDSNTNPFDNHQVGVNVAYQF